MGLNPAPLIVVRNPSLKTLHHKVQKIEVICRNFDFFYEMKLAMFHPLNQENEAKHLGAVQSNVQSIHAIAITCVTI